MSSLVPFNRRRIMSAEAPVDTLRYIKFVMTAAGEITLTIPAGVTANEYQYIEWSRDGLQWNRTVNDNTEKVISTGTISAGGKVYFRGKGSKMAISASVYSHFHASIETACSGDIRSLLEPEETDFSRITNIGDFAFCRLFTCFAADSSFTSTPDLPALTVGAYAYYEEFKYHRFLTQLPELPATTIGDYAYASMFEGLDTRQCSAPTVLPATDIGEFCYYRMFYACRITNAPEIMATELKKSSCEEMFQSTSELTVGPVIHATKVAESSMAKMFRSSYIVTMPDLIVTNITGFYSMQQMFYECSKLTKAPALPAVNLYGADCFNMYANCVNLKQGPELPARILTTYCYMNMFTGCSKLEKVTMLATDISASRCLENWLAYVAASGTFYKSASMVTLPTGASGIPSGWTVQDV